MQSVLIAQHTEVGGTDIVFLPSAPWHTDFVPIELKFRERQAEFEPDKKSGNSNDTAKGPENERYTDAVGASHNRRWQYENPRP